MPEGLVRQALDRMQFGVTISDSSGGIAYANPALEGMHGYGAGELVGQPSHVLGAPSARRTLAASDLSDRQMWRRETLNKRKNGETFPVHLTFNVLYDDAGAMQGLITICENISDQKQQQEQEEREALRDSLTGLASRGFFLQLVQRVVERRKRHTNRQFAVLYVDLDRFNLINESLGHEVGDRLLIGVADRLVACVRPSDVVARIAGDEFALLSDDLEGERGSAQVAQRILKEFEAAFEVAGRSLYVNPSIGIVLSDARYSSAEQYVADAAAAMNRARAQREGKRDLRSGGSPARDTATAARDGPPPGGRPIGIPRALPADRGSPNRGNLRLRGASAVESLGARDRWSQRVHPRRRRNGPDRAHRAGSNANGVRDHGGVARTLCGHSGSVRQCEHVGPASTA